jgi:hypothetical protein
VAREKSKLEVRDMNAPDEGAYLTKPNTQVDLERRQKQEAPDSAVGNTVVVNPNPFGADEYVGTDPIYQNYANDQNKPLASEDGVEKELEEAYKEEHEVDDEVSVEDHGTGGVAERAQAGTAGSTFRTILPGQEGYDLKKAEEQNGPPLRVYNDEEPGENDEDESDEGDEVAIPDTQPPASPAAPAVPSGGDDSKATGNQK